MYVKITSHNLDSCFHLSLMAPNNSNSVFKCSVGNMKFQVISFFKYVHQKIHPITLNSLLATSTLEIHHRFGWLDDENRAVMLHLASHPLTASI